MEAITLCRAEGLWDLEFGFIVQAVRGFGAGPWVYQSAHFLGSADCMVQF